MSRPLVSVILPCFNAERFLTAALRSVLDQTYRELEILALDDGSKDRTPVILRSYADGDRRLRVLSNRANVGLIETLNRGIAEAQGDFVVRMDADDVALRHRIERQVEALVANPNIDVVGAGVQLIDHNDRYLGSAPPRCTQPAGAQFMALFATPIVHPTLAARAAVMRAHPYGSSRDSLHAEDYELLTRLIASGRAIANVDEPLLQLRVNPASVSRVHEQLQVDNFVAIAKRHLEGTIQARVDSGTHKVVVNRIDRRVTARNVRDGLRFLDSLERDFRGQAPSSASEIKAIANEQRVDIFTQTWRRGAPRTRAMAGALLPRYLPRLLSAPGRRYLGRKIRTATRHR